MEEKIIVEGKTSQANIISALLVIAALVWLFGVGSSFGVVFDAMWDYPVQVLLPTVAFIIAAIVSFIAMRDCEIIVTDKRIYGKATFGARIDLPLDMISATSSGFLSSVSVSSSSGIIRFWLLENNDEIYSAIAQLLLERQNGKQTDAVSTTCNADELKKFKELLDMGVITQEEFDAKKKKLLNL